LWVMGETMLWFAFIDTSQKQQKDGFVLLFIVTTHSEFKCWCCIIFCFFILLFLPGRDGLCIKPLLVALLIILCLDQAHSNVFTVDDLDYLFGINGCMEGIAFLFFLFHVNIYCLLSHCVVLVHLYYPIWEFSHFLTTINSLFLFCFPFSQLLKINLSNLNRR
jgi:hypothetical protein